MTFLEVPFREKDQAKSLGARWDGASKKWYIPEGFDGDLELFQKWLKPSIEQASSDLFSQPITPQNSSNDTNKGIRLSLVLNKIQNVLRQGFAGGVWVVAEVANINTRRGHVYLELTETDDSGRVLASCRAMIWQSQASHLLQRFAAETGSELAIGQKILVLTEVSFHEQYGFSLVVQDLDPNFTLGELERRLGEIRKSLIKKGLYQKNKTFTLPADFFRLAVIAPPEAAGLGDFRADADVLQAMNLCDFKYFYSSFQGEKVESEMLAAIEAVQALHQRNPFDALVIIRGGGAKLDLNMLNIESIAEVLCLAELPVLSGIGHERDNTILDEVAHTQFDTPSKVIGYIRNQIIEQAKTAQANWISIEQSSRIKVQRLQQQINHLNHEITQNSLACVYRWQKRVEPVNYEVRRLSEQKIFTFKNQIAPLKEKIQSQVEQRLQLMNAALNQINDSIAIGAKRSLETQKQQIIQSISFILSSGPKTQLNRGFNIAKDSTGLPVTTAKKALTYTKLELEFADGIITIEVSKDQEIRASKL